MYGMVNRAIEEMVCGRYGESTWDEIKRRAGIDADAFISNEAYPDEVTYRLVAAASEILSLPAAEVLEAFGVHWVLHTAQEGYGAMMKAGGRSLPEFLRNLPVFHARVVLIYPNLQPPRFQISDEGAHSLHLHYYSHRVGLQPFVCGILKGLVAMFHADGRITTLQSKVAGGDHDEFLVEWT